MPHVRKNVSGMLLVLYTTCLYNLIQHGHVCFLCVYVWAYVSVHVHVHVCGCVCVCVCLELWFMELFYVLGFLLFISFPGN